MKISDKELETELNSARGYLKEVVARDPRPKLIERAQLQVDLLEELVLWRHNGRRWLEYLNSQQIDGRKDGQVLRIAGQTDKIYR